MTNGKQQTIMEFEKNRQQMLGISAQKQQLQFQSTTMKSALDELEKTSEKKVFKAVGNILIQAPVTEVKKELKEGKDAVDLRIKSLQKQEESLLGKLNKLRAEIEGKPPSETQVVETEKSEKTKEKKKK